MAFLDNSGDIVLDMVLTDTGRKRLAEGTFKIVKFALGDDEINYGLYNSQHVSGSSYYDLEILQTPVLEAMTNNMSSLKSHLLTIPRTNLLYLPILEVNSLEGTSREYDLGGFVVAVNKTTEDAFNRIKGVILGENPRSKTYIRVDQGLDTLEIPPSFTLDPNLVETQYIIEMDNRLGGIVDNSGKRAPVSYVDDDNVASYFLTLNTNSSFIFENKDTQINDGTEVISGPRGTSFKFRIKSSLELNTSTYLFGLLGSTTSMTGNAGATSVWFIDTIVRVKGGTTGYTLDIPVRFIRVV